MIEKKGKPRYNKKDWAAESEKMLCLETLILEKQPWARKIGHAIWKGP